MISETEVPQDQEDRIEQLYREHGHRILAYLARRTDPVEDAADLLSEVMLITWRRRDALPAAPDDVLWLFGVARHVLANHRRATVRRSFAVLQLAQLVRHQAPRTDHDAGGHLDNTLDMRRAISELPALDREILTLNAWEELTSTQIGTVLDMPAATVRSRLKRARAALRSRLTDITGDPPHPRLVSGVSMRRRAR